MTLKQIQYALMIAQCGSISKAASILFVSTPTLSEAICNLEEEIGFPLFIRSHSGMSVSREGKRFLEDAGNIMQQFDLLEKNYTKCKSIKFFSISSTHFYLTALAFSHLIEEYKDSSYKLRHLDRTKMGVIDDVAEGISDVGVLSISADSRDVTLRELKRKQLEYKVLKKVTPAAYVSINHPLADKPVLRIEELYPYPCGIFYQNEGTPLTFGEEFYHLPEQNKELYFTDGFTITVAMRENQCFSIGCGVVTEEAARFGIKAIPIIGVPPADIISIKREKRAVSEIEEQFFHYCLVELSDAVLLEE